jgi:phage gp36-like protein
LPSFGISVAALSPIPTNVQDDQCEAASREVDGYLEARYGTGSTPLLAFDTIIKSITGRIAAYKLLSIRGYNPASGADLIIRQNYLDALSECEKIGKQQLHPKVTIAVTGSAARAQQPTVITSSVVTMNGQTARTRGW